MGRTRTVPPTDHPHLSVYARHFGLRAEPFSLTPDPSFLYLSPGHAEALAALKIGLQERRGLMVMTGEVGTGKTTLLYSLLSHLDCEIHTAYISNTRLAVDDILRQALADFGIPNASRERVDLLTSLNSFLQQCADTGATAALVIDEAQNLDDDAFENIRLLSNFETFSAKLLQIVLVGQPELEARLASPSVRQINERIAVRCHVAPLSLQESRRYVEHRLERVGGSIDIFEPNALRLALRKSRGLPRRINIICHNALLFAYGHGKSTVPRSLVRTAVREREAGGLTARRRSAWPGLWSRLPFLRSAAVAAAITAMMVAVVTIALRIDRTATAPSPRGLSSQLSPQQPEPPGHGASHRRDAVTAPVVPLPSTALEIETTYREPTLVRTD